ncbi:MAG: WecB/TagA/CpsF family glycosyltransferase [Puniceicoccaceae bacterium]
MEVKILGIPFVSDSVEALVDRSLKGGLVVVPSGPGLAVDLRNNPDYRTAVTTADLALTDSGAMVLLWKLFRGKSIKRVSGLRFLKHLLVKKALTEAGATFWVHPNQDQQKLNYNWLKEQGFNIPDKSNYVAPMYPQRDIEDHALWEALKTEKPKAIVLCIGGGVQERLGWWLREQYRAAGRSCPAIICTGAAIGFLSGNQVNVPNWADKLFLTWLVRCVSDPKTFVPRYWSALPLVWMILKYGECCPQQS